TVAALDRLEALVLANAKALHLELEIGQPVGALGEVDDDDAIEAVDAGVPPAGAQAPNTRGEDGRGDRPAEREESVALRQALNECRRGDRADRADEGGSQRLAHRPGLAPRISTCRACRGAVLAPAPA